MRNLYIYARTIRSFTGWVGKQTSKNYPSFTNQNAQKLEKLLAGDVVLLNQKRFVFKGISPKGTSSLEIACQSSSKLLAKSFVSKPVQVAVCEPCEVKEEASQTPGVLLKRWKKTLFLYLKLSKHRLSSLVVFTAIVGYYMGCKEEGNIFQWKSFLCMTAGTGLAAASANAWNQIREIEKDSRMLRTRLRPLPAGLVSKSQAVIFAGLTAGAGACFLFLGVPDHGISAALGMSNVLLYAAVYTPLKVLHPVNTWVGAVVGAIPPMMGWSAATKGKIWESGSILLASTLFLWQIPHFHALAVMCYKDYCAGGYKMLGQLHPRANAVLALLTCIALLPLGPLAIHFDMTTSYFGWEATALGLWLLQSSFKLVRNPTSAQAARPLFRVSISYLPLFLGCMCFHRKKSMENAISIKEQTVIPIENRNCDNYSAAQQWAETSDKATGERPKKQRTNRVIYYPVSYHIASFPFLSPAMMPPAIVFDDADDGER
eukprot:jgi/Galph1/2586/GphlegSOOS_G1242.1